MNYYDPRYYPYFMLPFQGYSPYPPQYFAHSHHLVYHHPNYYLRQFPNVDPQLFMTSAKYMQSLMKDASALLERMATSKEFASQLMSNAQESKQKLVENQIKQTGITNIPSVSYTPDGLELFFRKDIDSINCCNLTLTIRWM